MSGKLIGYIRVSSELQNTDRQLDGIKLDKIYTDKLSGKTIHLAANKTVQIDVGPVDSTNTENKFVRVRRIELLS